MYRHPRYYGESDPEPEPDEIVTPRHLWAGPGERHCDACLQAAVATCTIERGEEVDPAKFRVCYEHAVNCAMSGGNVDLW